MNMNDVMHNELNHLDDENDDSDYGNNTATTVANTINSGINQSNYSIKNLRLYNMTYATLYDKITYTDDYTVTRKLKKRKQANHNKEDNDGDENKKVDNYDFLNEV